MDLPNPKPPIQTLADRSEVVFGDDESRAQGLDKDGSLVGSETKDLEKVRYKFCIGEEKTGFSADDLVWGKVKSHPWWPGQIFDPKYASEMAMKREKKDHFLVAYFGDKTFAWVPDSNLKHFLVWFKEMEKQSGMEAFVRAVGCALEEVSRRVELGMACHCLEQERYAGLMYKKVENAGIREGACSVSSIDRALFVNGFQAGEVVEYVQALSKNPFGGFDRLELTVAMAHLRAFYRWKGCPELPVIVYGDGLVENDAEISGAVSKVTQKERNEDTSGAVASSVKSEKRGRGRPRKIQIPDDDNKKSSLRKKKEQKDNQLASSAPVVSGVESGKRPRVRPRKYDIYEDDGDQKSLSEEMEDEDDDDDSLVDDVKSGPAVRSAKRSYRKNRKNADSDSSRLSTRIRSVKIGDRMIHVAGQLRESPIIPQTIDGAFQTGSARRSRNYAGRPSKVAKETEISVEDCSPIEVLSQLFLLASDPIGTYSFLPTVKGFFTYFRASKPSTSSTVEDALKPVKRKRGRPKKTANSEPASSELSESDYMKDSYWSDIVLHSSPERESASKSQKKKGTSQKAQKKSKTCGEPLQFTSANPSLGTGDDLLAGTLNSDEMQDKKEERNICNIIETNKEETPTALILSFNESDALPSVAGLIKIFSHFGPLREDETEVLRKTSRAKVVFKYRLDAEKAFSSAGKYSAFGPALVSYRLRYSPSPKSSPAASPQDDNATSPQDNITASQDNNAASPQDNNATSLQENNATSFTNHGDIELQAQGEEVAIVDARG